MKTIIKDVQGLVASLFPSIHRVAAPSHRRLRLSLITLILTLGVGQMWGNYAYLDLTGFTSWYEGSAKFRVDKNGKANNPDIFRPTKSEVSELCSGDSSAMITIQGVPLADISIDKKEQSPKARLVSETGINKENPTPTIVSMQS